MDRLRQTLRVAKERAILVAAVTSRFAETDDLAELAALARSAGAVVVDRFQQKIRKINASTYLGKGKVEELARRVKRFNADVIIFDNNLSPAQIRDLEEITQTKVLDRSELILDIFAARAKTRQAQLQVDLAQLEYIYPRLTRMWSHLDSVAGAGGATAAGTVGAIGTRGTGEQQLEIDRRLVTKKITELKHQLAEIDKRRIREIDGRRGLFKICLVGYTNAGKSTLLNTLTDAGVLVEDRLFSTLDTRTRKWTPARGVEVLLSDTVGFVRNLPHQLVASFKATLEETVNADLLIHVIDASNGDALKQIDSVNAVLAEIGCGKHPVLKALNKVDVVGKLGLLETLQILFPDSVSISAKTGLGIDVLGRAVVKIHMGDQINIRLTCHQSNGKIQSFLRTHARITKEDYSDSEVTIEATIGNSHLLPLKSLNPISLQVL
ncbi:MAG TPA: GTPase HflX [Sedimentisphaerales bacterium]|nr:GTPase HflX [Sedimentisphaerales bacterium]